MNSSLKSKIILITTLLVTSLVLGLHLGHRAVENWGKISPGFSLYTDGEVNSLVHSQWDGYQQGLKIGDRILSYNHEPFTSKTQFEEFLQTSTLEPIDYKIQRGQNQIELNITPHLMNKDQFILVYFPNLFLPLVLILSGTILFYLRPQLKTSFAFCLVCYGISIFHIINIDYYTDQNFLFLYYLALILFTTTCYHNSLCMPERSPWLKKNPHTIHLIYAVLFGVSFLIFGLSLIFGWELRQVLKVGIWAALIGFTTAPIISLSVYFTAQNSLVKKQFSSQIVSYLFLIPTYLYYLLREVFGIIIPHELLFLQIYVPPSILYSILRYNGLDFQIHLNRRQVLSILNTFFLMSLIMVLTVIPPAFRVYDLNPHFLFPVIGTLITLKVAFLLYALETRLFDRLFFYSSFKFSKTIRETNQQISTLLSREEILKLIQAQLDRDFKINDYLVYFKPDLKQDSFQLFLNSQKFDKIPDWVYPDFVSTLAQDFLILQKPDTHLAYFNHQPFEILFPLRFQNQSWGLVVLGQKKQGTPYGSEDLENLQTFFTSTISALLNAYQYEELRAIQTQLQQENTDLKQKLESEKKTFEVIGEKKGLQEIFHQIKMMRETEGNVLIRGESGTGKEVIAQEIHHQSLRNHEAFVAINCTAIPENLLESELFGHEKGAFTGAIKSKKGLFEAAHGGTLFLDEIGDLSLPLQVKLLRVLQEKEIKPLGSNESIKIDVRILSATHKDLEKEVQEGRFRQDLYFRLNVLPVYLPPLRERMEDLHDFIHFFIQKFSGQMNKTVGFPDTKTIQKLKSYEWPGNIRELQNVIERSIALCPDGQKLEIKDFEKSFWFPQPQEKETDAFLKIENYHERMNAFQKFTIEEAIKKASGNKSQAARSLGIHKTHLYKMIRQLE